MFVQFSVRRVTMRRLGSQVNIDDLALDEKSMELELIKLQANYRHLSDFYESYKEETQRNLKKQKLES